MVVLDRLSRCRRNNSKSCFLVTLSCIVSDHKLIGHSQHIYAKIEFGDASTRHGVFKVISVLQLLINWAEAEYRPWFEENAIVKG